MSLNLKVLLVDDEMTNIILFEELLKQEGFNNYMSFTKPMEALAYIEKNVFDIVIVDYHMPKINGIEFIKCVKEFYPDIVSIMITVDADETTMIKALKAGVTDFLTRPISPVEFMLRLNNIAQIKTALNTTNTFNKLLEQRINEATKALKQSEYEVLEVLSRAAEYKDPETGSHIYRVSHYSRLLAAKLGMSEEEQTILFYAAPLHDIGKIGIKDDILLKVGKLTDDEFEIMKEHSYIGMTILEGKDNVFLKAGEIIAHTHHEKFNGKGYPKGLKGEEIHIYGRIVAIADVFDALISVRPYKKAWSFAEAKNYLIEEKDKQFDPKLVDLFIDSMDEVRDIFDRFQE